MKALLLSLIVLASCSKKMDYSHTVKKVQPYKTEQNTLGIRIEFDRPIEQQFSISFEVKLTDGYASWALMNDRVFEGCMNGNLFYETTIHYDKFKDVRIDEKTVRRGKVYILDIFSKQGYIFNYKKYQR